MREPISKAKNASAKWTLELILMHLLSETNRWHFKNSSCFCSSLWRLKHTITFQNWQWDSSAGVVLGWQTPALIQPWMMSPIHYTMIKSLHTHTHTHTHTHISLTSLLWTRHSSRPHVCLFSASRWVLGDWGRGGTSLPRSLSSPGKWGMMGKDPVTRQWVRSHIMALLLWWLKRGQRKTWGKKRKSS